MKKHITILLSVIALFATAQSKQKFDVIVGVHSGIYSTLYQYGNYYHISAYQGDEFSRESLSGFAIPVNVELLFHTYGFRSGLRAEYAAGLYFQEGSVMHLGNIMGCVEYAFKVKPKLIIAPSFSAGGSGLSYRDDGGYGAGISEIGYVLRGALNFETGVKQVKFTVSPTYSFNSLKGGGFSPSLSRLHTFGLNLGVRFHLLKPKTENK